MKNGIDYVPWVGRSTPTSLHLLALQLKLGLLVRFESALDIHTILFGFNPGDARDRSLIGRGVVTAHRNLLDAVEQKS